MDGARDLDFYGYWVTGRNREFNWVKGTDIENIRVFAPGIQPSYHRGNYENSVSLDQFDLIPENTLPSNTRILEGGPGARNLFDGNLKTAWKAPLGKARVVMDLGESKTVHRYTLVDGHLMNFEDKTAVKEYRISVSLDNKTWTLVEIPKTTFRNYGFKNPRKLVVIDQPVVPTKARYVKLEILDVWEAPSSKGAPDTRSAVLRSLNIWTNSE